MATYTPTPYFPQSWLSPPDEKRDRKLKLNMFSIAIILLLILGGAIAGMIYLFKSLF